uniref:peptide-methionine (S)-S-oxide reductase n=1 Tax=Tetraodon nigroviridis TaxID=99883 RepID=H3C6Q2_TETNG
MLTSSRLRLSFRHFVNGRMGDMSCKAKLPTPETALPGRSDSIEVAGKRSAASGRTLTMFDVKCPEVFFNLFCYSYCQIKYRSSFAAASTSLKHKLPNPQNQVFLPACVFARAATANVLTLLEPFSLVCAYMCVVIWESVQTPNSVWMRSFNELNTSGPGRVHDSIHTDGNENISCSRLFPQCLTESGFGPVTTEIAEAQPFYYAEDYHQQYLNKVPDGYCGLKGTGVSCPKAITGKH